MSALRIAIPGQPPRLIPDRDPYASLTLRERHVLQVVRSYGGNLSRAARELGIDVSGVQHTVRRARAAGIHLPRVTRKGVPNGAPRAMAARCVAVLKTGPCGRPEAHRGRCVSVTAWQRRRAA